MYSVDLKNIVPKGGLTCLFAKATSDESKLWHRRLGHLNFKTMNKLVKGNLVRGLPSKLFENDQTCVACQKGKQHRASCTKASDNAGQARKETEPVKDYILLPLWTDDLTFSQKSKSSHDDGFKPSCDNGKKVDEDPRKDSESTNVVNAVGGKTSIELPFDPNMPALEDVSIFDFSRDDEDDGAEADMNNYIQQSNKQKKEMAYLVVKINMLKNLMKFGFTEVQDCKHTNGYLKASAQILKMVPQPSNPSENVANEAVNKELGDSLVRVATTSFSLEAEQDSGNITKTRSKATPNESSSLGTTSSGGPSCQETIGDTISQTRFENVSKLSNDSLLVRANEIASLKWRVKKLEKKRSSRTHKLKRLYKVGLSARVESSRDEESLGEDASKQGRINAIDVDEDITLVNVQDDVDKEMYDVGTVTGDEVFAEQKVVAKDVNLTVDEVTLAQSFEALKSVKPKVSAATITTDIILTPRKGIVITELGTPTITRSSQQPSHAKVQDKGKGKMIEPEPVKKMSKKDQLRSDEEEAKRLQSNFDEEERLAREKDEANVSLTKEWDDIHANIKADQELAQRLQVEEQEELSVKENANLFQQLLEQRRKHFAAKSAEKKRNKPPTQAQQRKIIAFKRVNTFVDFRTDLVEGSSKRAEEELEQENEEEVAIDAVPLATKPPTIVDWKIHKEGKNSYFQIIRADGSSKMYLGDLKTMFEPHVEDEIWKLQQRYKVLSWKLFDSCGVHCLSLKSRMIYMLVEKRYPLTPPIIKDMLNKKLQVDYFSEMAYQLLKLLTKQLKN
ncbi:retrovirus-related pol polyprotein from transposon TNT 1-94 [Tanacetum coccineum]|uniref:Retrovirus-related pol polyprotein from transposon TNT 1-94 n=1 Tax=Tanacetum coccineum TaxID=301880 RepID=A0ABQ4XHW8_9ASTR